MCLVSIIVPIYNVEEYLSKCIYSLINQTLKDIEIILVNDGSTDRSRQIAEYYTKKDRRIMLINKKNEGLSSARNEGLKYAKGDYIAFVDSDDWVIKNSYERLVRVAKQTSSEMVLANALFCYKNGKRERYFKKIDYEFFKEPIKGKDCFVELSKAGSQPPMACVYLYKRSFIEDHDLKFINTIHEDEIWTTQALCLASRVKVEDFNFYAYVQRNGSIMHSVMNEKRVRAFIYVANKLVDIASAYDFSIDKEVKSWIYVKVYWLYKCAFSLLQNIENKEFIIPENYINEYKKIKYKLSELAKNNCDLYYDECLKYYGDFKNKISSSDF